MSARDDLIAECRRHVAPAIDPYDGLGWGHCLALALPTDLAAGFPLGGVEIRHDPTPFELPETLRPNYEEYFEEFFMEKGFARDGEKLALVRNPGRGDDPARLVLHTQDALYSEVQFYRDCVAPEPSLRDELIREVVEDGSLSFPSSLCMHLVVETGDGRLLLAKRSETVAYHPGAWALTLEEQAEQEDLEDGGERAPGRWLRRALREELFLTDDAFADDDARVMSCFLESDVMNVGLCVHVKLGVGADDLVDHLRGRTTDDSELVEHQAMHPDELPGLLTRGSLELHPATGYRIVAALLRSGGVEHATEVLAGVR